MTPTARLTGIDDEDAAETEALIAAVAEADADPRAIPHEAMRAWLAALASGDFAAPPPEAGPSGIAEP